MHRLDLASFKRHWFVPNYAGTVTWSRGEHKTGSVGYRLWPDRMQLHYSHTSGAEKHDVEDTFHFAFTAQHFGGQRRWIVCPSCQRRCSVLYGGARFRCRQCHGAVYESQYETYRIVGLSKAETMRKRLGAEPGISNPLPPKPKGMHWRTYRRIEDANWNAMLDIDRILNGIAEARHP